MRKFLWSFFEVFETVVIAVIAVVLIRSFIAQPFLVSGSSMEPSFHNGDYLLVDELTYNFRKPERGEVVVFDSPAGGAYYIKRIIGLPGETVILDNGRISVMGHSEEQVLSEGYTLGGDVARHQRVELGDDEYFVMGDNRNFSFDSRNWGALEEGEIVGLARLRLWPLGSAKAIEAPAY